MSWTHSNAARDAANDGRLALIGAGSKIELRTGAKSLTATGTLLYDFALAAGFGASSSGAAALAGVPLTALAIATDTIGHCRVTGTDGVTGVLCGDAGLAANDFPIAAGSLSVVIGQPLTISGWTYTTPTESA